MEKINQLTEQYELVKEIHYIFENVNPKIIGRIYKIILGANASFTWEINYYCRQEGEASVYVPSAPYSSTLDEIEYKPDKYAKRFENAFDWKRTTSFNPSLRVYS